MVRPVRTQHVTAAGVVDLARGDPHPELLPIALVRAAVDRATAGLDPDVLQYGYEPGDERLRAGLAAVLGRHGGVAPSPDRLFVTAGASVALDLICTLFARPGDRVLVATPSYHLALALFADHGLGAEAVDSDAQGIDPAALDAALRRAPAAFVYLVPVHGNPTGATIDAARRAALLEVVERHGTRLVSDEVYRLTGFAGRGDDADAASLWPGLAAAGSERVLALGSLSKVLSPGLRLGWIEGPERDLERIARSGLLRSGGGMNPFVGAVVAALLESGDFEDHLGHVRERLRQRYRRLRGALARELGDAAHAEVAGGYFVWPELPGVDTGSEPFAGALARHGVRVAAGAQFAASGGDAAALRARVRLCFAHAEVEDLERGVARLAAAVRERRG